jgi:hypothetical protein
VCVCKVENLPSIVLELVDASAQVCYEELLGITLLRAVQSTCSIIYFHRRDERPIARVTAETITAETNRGRL